MAGRPESRADLLAMLKTHPGWNALKEEFGRRCTDEMDRIVNGTLFDQESIAKHHISIGRVRATVNSQGSTPNTIRLMGHC